MNARLVVALGALAGAAVITFACSTREYALCREHPEEDPVRCGDAGIGEAGNDGGVCPSDMVFIPVGSGYCIDAKETTVAQYKAFFESSPTAKNTTLCGWKQQVPDFEPDRWDTAGQLAPGRDDHPVVGVDWCDAYEYCTSKGKHLCGAVGGGPAVYDVDDGGAWFAACTHGGDGFFPYPWGRDASAKASCNGNAHANAVDAAPGLLPVGSLSSCEGPYKGLYDLLGNAAEWIDSCKPNDDIQSGPCTQRGGDFDASEYLECSSASAYASRNGKGTNTVSPNVGIRCCKP